MENRCVFCDAGDFGEQLIAERDGFYVVASLGQITDGGYVLLIPKEHVPCMGALPADRDAALEVLAVRIRCTLSMEYRGGPHWPAYPVTVFEHGIVGQTIRHAHWHFLPPGIDLTPRVRKDFPAAKIEMLGNPGDLGKRYRKYPQPYLFWTDSSDACMVCWNPPAPPQYLRTITAGILGVPERANWRTMDAELDGKLRRETVRRLKPHF